MQRAPAPHALVVGNGPGPVELTYGDAGFFGRQRRAQRPCLAVLDMSCGFTSPDSPLWCDLDDVVAAIAELLAAARAAAVPIVYTRIAYDEAGILAARPFIEKARTLARLRSGSRWTEIDERLAPRDGEPVLTKLFASGFFGTELQSFLVARRCDGLILTGAWTSGCVRATAVDALQHGYRVVVPREAVADRAAGPHEGALFDIDATYGDVTTLADALEYLDGRD